MGFNNGSPSFDLEDDNPFLLGSQGAGSGQAGNKKSAIRTMLDPAGIFGGNRGLSQDQKINKMLDPIGITRILGGDLSGSSVIGQSKNERDDYINSLGTTPAPVFGSPMEIQSAEQKYSSPVNKSIWSMYNPKGNY